MRRWLNWLVWVVAGTAVYLSFLDNREPIEYLTGALVTTGAYLLARITFRTAGLSYTPELPRLWRLWTVVKITAAESWAVFLALVRHLTGRQRIAGEVVAIPLRDEPNRGPGAAAFDAAITVEAGLAPNTFIVGKDDEDGVLLVHQLVRRGDPEHSFPRWTP